MDEIVEPFLVKYLGRDADQHVIDAESLGESITGAAKLYTGVAHYCMFGFIPRRNYRKELTCFARPLREGSIDQWLLIGPMLAGEYALHANIYSKATSFIFSKVVDSLKQAWTRPKEIQAVIETLNETLREQARLNAEIQQQLVQGIVRANDNMASLHGKLIETIPQLAEAMRPHAKHFVKPVGETCTDISQFAETAAESRITEADAEVIRGDAAMEVDAVSRYNVTRISEINVRTGHCVLDVEGIAGSLPGKITDPVLKQPHNVYTQALDNHTGCTVNAKAIRRDGVIERLYISDAN